MSESPFNIQLATAADTDAVTALVSAAYSKWIPITGTTPMPMLADYSPLIAQNYVYTVREGEHLVGVLVIWQEEDALYIDNIAVHPEHQRRGIGDILLNFAEQKAREMNLMTMSLMTNEKMESNQAYYRKHGYIEVNRYQFAENRRAVVMHKHLSTNE
jgi:ribosomal protein S18 acetylase RimI-like enzyme